MKYSPPVGATDPNEGYIDEKLAAGIEGSPVPATAIEHPQREIVHAITEAGLIPDELDLTQLARAINILSVRPLFVTCATAASVAEKSVNLTGLGLSLGTTIYVLFDSVNTASNPTLKFNDTEAKPITYCGVPVEVGMLAKGQVYTMICSGNQWQIIGGMSPYPIGQYVWWEDELVRPGFKPANANIISDFAATYPQMAAYLSTAHGARRCFASLAEYEAAHDAAWATLADGSQVKWNNIGGVAKFWWDKTADTLLMPDLTEMTRFMAGASLDVGGVDGDRGRDMVAAFGQTVVGAGVRWAAVSGAFELLPSQPGGQDSTTAYNNGTLLRLRVSRVWPTGPNFAPRRWGALACVYLGQPAS